MHVWLAILPPIAPKGVLAQLYSRANDDRTVGFEVFNCLIGQVAFQVLHWKGYGHIIDEVRACAPDWRSLTAEIWPNTNVSVAWPPPAHLTVQGTGVFLNRFVI